MLDMTKAELDQILKSDGYNIGINYGAIAGQTVPHLRIHREKKNHLVELDPANPPAAILM